MAKITQGIGKKLNASEARASISLHKIAQKKPDLVCCNARFLGEIVISEENVQVLLPASSILQMATVREACCKFLMRQLHPTNCLGIRSFAGKNVTKISEQHPFRLVNCKTILVFNYDFNFRYPCL